MQAEFETGYWFLTNSFQHLAFLTLLIIMFVTVMAKKNISRKSCTQRKAHPERVYHLRKEHIHTGQRKRALQTGRVNGVVAARISQMPLAVVIYKL